MSAASEAEAIEVVDELTAGIMRRMSAARKMQMVDELVEFGRRLMAAGVRADHADWSEEAVAREVARRLAGDSL